MNTFSKIFAALKLLVILVMFLVISWGVFVKGAAWGYFLIFFISAIVVGFTESSIDTYEDEDY